MRQYSEEFKANIIARMLPPNNVDVPQLSQETGISKNTLYTWRIKHRKSQGDTPAPQEKCKEKWGQKNGVRSCNHAYIVYVLIMVRPLRIELAGGLYHVTSRGDRREAIYRDDQDRAVLTAA